MKKTISGFTVIEMLVVVSIIGVLTTIAFVSYSSIQASTRDSNRSSQLTVIAEYLETYYDDNGEYPSCNDMTADPDTIATDTLIGIDPKVFTDPTASEGSNSILPLCSEVTSETPNSFTYMGDGSSDCITESCPEYTLKYYENATGNVISISSRRSPSLLAGQPDAPVIDVTLNGSDVLATLTTVSCSTGDVQYGIRYRTNDGVWSDYTTWSSTTTHTQTANEGIKYGYQARSRCFVSDFAYSSASVGTEDTYVHPISSTPAAPVVTASSLVWPSTQFSWTTPSCPAESSARYQYRYWTSYGYVTDPVWIEVSASPVSYTTSQTAQTYYIEVQAQCFNANDSGDWGAIGSTSYYRPTPNVQTLVIAGGGGGGAGDSYGNGGGGGAGGYIYNASLGLSAQGYAVTVGGGGSGTLANGSGSYWGRGTNGANSVFAGLTAIGGGGGGGGGDGSPGTGSSGGSGGGASGSSSSTRPGASGTAGQGNAGGNTCSDDSRGSSGGGGATSAGGANAGCSNNGTAGGAGYTTSISGSSVCYAGGGGGGVGSGSVGSGQCGGGNGSASSNGGTATANTGGGGGGGKTYGGGGGSGVVIIRYITGSMGAGGGDSVYTSGSYTVHRFTSSGTFTVY